MTEGGQKAVGKWWSHNLTKADSLQHTALVTFARAVGWKHSYRTTRQVPQGEGAVEEGDEYTSGSPPQTPQIPIPSPCQPYPLGPRDVAAPSLCHVSQRKSRTAVSLLVQPDGVSEYPSPWLSSEQVCVTNLFSAHILLFSRLHP